MSKISTALCADALTPNAHLILADIVEPRAPTGSDAAVIKADLTDRAQVDTLFSTRFGIPDTIYCLQGIMSRGSEENFDLGIKVRMLFLCPYICV